MKHPPTRPPQGFAWNCPRRPPFYKQTGEFTGRQADAVNVSGTICPSMTASHFQPESSGPSALYAMSQRL